jgi:sulfotransferase family protein
LSAKVRALDAATARIPLDVRHRIAQLRVQARTPTGGLRRLPDLLVIGGQRCGTSTLYRYLGRHPDVAPSLRKEVEYFSRRFDRGERWYRAHFALANGRSRLAFEATPDYLFHPLAADRAAAVVPGARIVVMLREPTARAWSHYHHMVALGHETLDFEAAVAAEADRCIPDLRRLADDPHHDPVSLLRYSYVARGRYVEQLVRWRDHFPPDRMLVVRSEDFFADPAPVFRRVVEFLGLSPWAPDHLVNVSRQGRPAPPPIPARTRATLAERFADSNRDLVAVLGDDAPRW